MQHLNSTAKLQNCAKTRLILRLESDRKRHAQKDADVYSSL